MNDLIGVPETMLIPLWAKATEINYKDPIIRDNKAVEIFSKIDYDFSKFKKSWLSQIGVVIRTKLLDNAVKDFLNRNHNSIIINIGAGLDTRFERLKDNRIEKWYDIDLPQSINIRKKFFKEGEKTSFISKSVFDFTWMDEIQQTKLPVLIIAEGILMYFSEDMLTSLFNKLIEKFENFEILFDVISEYIVKHSDRHDSINRLESSKAESIKFQWGINNPKEIEKWNSKIKFKNSWNYYDYYKRRWSWFGLLIRIPFLRKKLSCYIVHFEIE